MKRVSCHVFWEQLSSKLRFLVSWQPARPMKIIAMNRTIIALATLTVFLPSHASTNDEDENGDLAELPRDVKSLSDKGLGYFMFHGEWMCR